MYHQMILMPLRRRWIASDDVLVNAHDMYAHSCTSHFQKISTDFRP